MKYFLGTLLVSFLMNGNVSAGCFRPFTITGTASSEPEALKEIEREAVRECGNDEFQWASLFNFLGSHAVEIDGAIMIKAHAQYRCCFAW